MLPMKTLATIFADAGCADVSTYIQSGNVLFTANAAAARGLADAVAARIARQAKLQVPVVLRRLARREVVPSLDVLETLDEDLARSIRTLADTDRVPDAELVNAELPFGIPDPAHPGEILPLRAGQPCLRCRNTIIRAYLGKHHRSTYACPSCQSITGPSPTPPRAA
jgi:hypothetical protein